MSERSRMNDDDDEGILLLTVACILKLLHISFNLHAKLSIGYGMSLKKVVKFSLLDLS